MTAKSDSCSRNLRYIALEGPDGAGTTTLMHRLEQALLARGDRVLPIAEPSSSAIGQVIRGYLLNGYNPQLPEHRHAMWHLFWADRIQLTLGLSERAKNYDYIISDRCHLSSAVYQAGVTDASEHRMMVSKLSLVPDTVFVVQGPGEVLQQRIDKRPGYHDTVETPTEQSIYRTRYADPVFVLGHLTEETSRVYYLDATEPEMELCAKALQLIDQGVPLGSWKHATMAHDEASA